MYLSVPKFTEDVIQSRTLKKFSCETQMKNRSSQILDEHLTSMMVLIPALLTERGFFSQQPFMPEVNHRHIDHHVMQYEHANGRAIMRAFANPEPNESFNN